MSSLYYDTLGLQKEGLLIRLAFWGCALLRSKPVSVVLGLRGCADSDKLVTFVIVSLQAKQQKQRAVGIRFLSERSLFEVVLQQAPARTGASNHHILKKNYPEEELVPKAPGKKRRYDSTLSQGDPRQRTRHRAPSEGRHKVHRVLDARFGQGAHLEIERRIPRKNRAPWVSMRLSACGTFSFCRSFSPK